jgi:RNA 2',3'-cyclic 3'-phosphodiesterase
MAFKRLFIAIPIPTQIRQALSGCKSFVNIPGLSWVKEENLHITLLFLGNTAVEKIPGIEQKLSALTIHPPFMLHCKAVEPVIKRGKLTMLWAAFEENQDFVRLATGISQTLNHPPDHSPLPHVTLARVKKGQLVKIHTIQLPTIESYQWQVKEYGLWESVLTPQGPEYTKLKQWDLKGNQ